MRVTLSEEERAEVHEGLKLRLEELKKGKKNCEALSLHAGVREAEEHMTILRGKDGDPGLMSKFVDQTTLDFNAGKSEPGGNGELPLDEHEPGTKRRRARATAKTTGDGEAPATEGGPDFEVEETPPPKAGEVDSLVPHTNG